MGSERKSKLVAKSLKFQLERVKGIEPSYSAWKAAALPLSYTRVVRSPNTACRLPQPPQNPPGRAALGPAALKTGPVPAEIAAVPHLNNDRFAAYTLVSTTNERR